MAQGEFLWCDLATFDVDRILPYYSDLFGWEMKPETFPDGSTYYYASCSNEVTAGIYEMPDDYRTDMPSFWMTYIGVDEMVDACELVPEIGGRVLLGPASFGRGAAIALIEDPFGARFTFFTGSYLQPRTNRMIAGGYYWNELYTPDLQAAAEFYRQIFGWKFEKPDATGRMMVNNLAGSPATAFQDNRASDAPLNTPQWTVSFAAPDLEALIASLSTYERENMLWIKNRNSAAVCVSDPNGAVFVVAQYIEGGGWFS